MLYDTMDHLSRCLGMDPNFDTAIRWLSEHSLAELPLGRTEIAGSDVFINVMDAVPRAKETAEYEVHAQYMDLQMDILGREGFAVACGPTQVTVPFDAEKDIGFLKGDISAEGTLMPGRFVLFPNGEPHMPTLYAGDASVRKAVCKIRASRG